jgi:hypothetical protein
MTCWMLNGGVSVSRGGADRRPGASDGAARPATGRESERSPGAFPAPTTTRIGEACAEQPGAAQRLVIPSYAASQQLIAGDPVRDAGPGIYHLYTDAALRRDFPVVRPALAMPACHKSARHTSRASKGVWPPGSLARGNLQ